jgi:hypothetical protein
MTLTNVSNALSTDAFIALDAASSSADSSNSDGDAQTNVYHTSAWSSLFGSWPGNTDADLYTLTFAKVEGGNENYQIDFSSESNAAGFDLILEPHVPPVPLSVVEQSIDENSGEGQVIATVEGGPANATYSLVDNTNYGGGDSGSAETQIVIPELQADTQHVYVSESTLSEDGSQATITVAYNAADTTLTGLGLHVHYDGSVLTLAGTSDVLSTDLFIQPNDNSEGAVADDNDATDSYVMMSWSSLFGAWPGSGPVNLATLTFDVADGAGGPTPIDFTVSSNAAGQTFAGQEHTIQLPAVGPLSIDSATGAVTLNVNPDFESVPVYDFDVVANGGEASASASVNIGNVDEVSPVFADSAVVANSIAENSGAGQVIYTAQADDSADASAGVSYSLAGDDAAAFSVNNSGEVALTANPDFEAKSSYSFTVVADDGINASASQDVTLAITNVDDTAPVFSSSADAGSIEENSGAGQVIYTAEASDETSGVTYSLVGADAGAFAIDPNGVVTLTANPDYETQNSYSFDVVATDDAGNASQQTVSLAVTNVDDTAPAIISGSDAGSIEENSGAGQVVYIAEADDSADVSNGYTFSLGGADAGAFTIDDSSGAVTLINDPDYEAKSSYSFTVTATDDAGNSSVAQDVSLSVSDVPDFKPVFSSANSVSVDENSGAGNIVLVVSATPDPVDNSELYPITYFLADDANGNLSIDSTTGEVTLAADPDFETQQAYYGKVVAIDALQNTSEQDITVDVNNVDEAPATITSGDTADAIDENGESQVIYTATADDSGDVSDGVTFSLAAGSDSGLSIDAATGEVSIDGAADHEDKSQYTFAVVATDLAGNISQAQSVTLDINDLDDAAPTVISADSADSVDENSASGQVVYTAASDDSGDDVADGPISYSLADGSDSEFSIDSATGEVSFNAVADHEEKSNYSFAVIATDAAGNASEAQSVTLDINDLDDAAPSVTSSGTAASIDENSGSQIIYTATADDSGDDVVDGPVTFSLADGSDAALSIDSNTGEVSIDVDPNHEAQGQYSFAVIATDAAGNSSEEKAVTLDINDLDELAPLIFAPAVDKTLPAFSDAGQTIFSPAGYSDSEPTLEAAYDDRADVISEPLTFAISFDADNQQYAGDFSINENTGEVTYDAIPATELDSLTIKYTVTATDGSGYLSSVDLNLVISGNEEDRPLFDIPSEEGEAAAVVYEQTGSELVDQTASGQLEQLESVSSVRGDISEDFIQGDTVIYDASVSDVSQIKYTLADDNAALTIDENTGEVTLVGGADFDSVDQYNFTVVATDTSGNASEQAVTLDVREAYLSVGENSPANQVVYTAVTGNSSDTFRLAEGHHEALAINSSTGEVFLLESPDYEVSSEYAFIVEAFSDTVQVGQYPVYVAVNNVDDTAPDVTSGDEAEAIDENSGSGQLVYTATADDSLDSSGAVTFSLASGSDSALSIDSSSGEVELNESPDHETQSEYNFTVVATDFAGNASQQSVSLQINDLDEINPVIGDSVSIEITENNPASQVIFTASGHDATSVISQGAIRQEFVRNADDTLTVKFFVEESAATSDLEAIQFTFNYESEMAGILSPASEETIEYPSDPFAGVANTETYGQINFALLYTPAELSGISSKGLYDIDGDIAIAEVTFEVGNHDSMSTFTVSEVGFKESGSDNSSYPVGQSVSEYAMNDGGRTSFSLADGHDAALSIDSSSGEVTLSGSADYEAADSYTFTVVASDASGNTSEQNVSVSVNNLDEVAPTFTSGDAAAAIDENSGAGQVIYTASADDSADVSGGVSFSLGQDSDEALSIDESTGKVVLTADPDHEVQSEYSFTVIATDAAGNSSEQSVSLNINNLDDTAATITSGGVADSIDENTGSGQVIYTVTADDSNDFSDGLITFSLAEGSDPALSIDGANVVLNVDPDHESQSEYTFTVVATDSEDNVSESQTVTLNINDIDDTKPEITSGSSALSIDENSGAGQIVYTATADDSFDVSDGVTFALSNNDPALSINSVTGEVTLSDNPDYEDEEIQGSYSFDVVAEDSNGNTSTQSIVLEINNVDEIAPTITSGDSAGRLDENTGSGQVVYTAIVDDSADISAGVTFSLADGSAPGLVIDADTGVVTLVKKPDYESLNEYGFTVVATDAAGNSSDQAVTLNIDPVTDVRITHWGSNIRVAGVKIKQGGQEIGVTDALGDKKVGRDFREGEFSVEREVESNDSVGVVDAADALAAIKMAVRASVDTPNTGNQYDYDASKDFDGDGSLSDLDLMNLAADFNNDGKVSSKDALEILKFAAGMSDAALPSWMFVKNNSERVGDDESPEDSATYTALIKGDINANWTSSRAEQEVEKDHNLEAGDVVYRFDTAKFSFKEVEGSEGIFNVSSSGEVTSVSADSGKFSFALENLRNGAERVVTVKVSAEDNSGPDFVSATEVSVASGVEAGNVVYTAVATDDSKLVKYRLADDSEGFSIHGRKGHVTLDHDTHESDAPISFTVIARDLDGNETSQTVTLTVDAIPDTSAPVIGSAAEVTISENTEDNVIYVPEAVDAYGNDITFTLGRGSDPALSIVNGVVVLNENANNEGQSIYKFRLIATDSMGNSSNQVIRVNVDDLDEIAPTITSSDEVAAIDENSGSDQVVYIVTSDDSADKSDGVVFTLSDDSDSALTINEATGEVSLTVDPDFEQQSEYSFTAVATDAAGNSSEKALTLSINNIDEVAPNITSSDSAVTIDENSGAGQVVYTATATDSDDVSHGLEFILSGEDSGSFSIDNDTGEVTLLDDPNYEDQSSYSFTVEAHDAAGHVSYQSVSLSINNLDELAPVISVADSVIEVDENTGAGLAILTVSTDDTSDTSGGVNLRLSGSDASAFELTNGVVTLRDDANYESQSSYNFSVIATDAAGNTSVQEHTLNVNNIDEMAPVMISGSTGSVVENSGSNQVIYSAQAIDTMDISGGVTYSLVVDAPNNTFTPSSIPNVQTVFVEGSPVASAGQQVEVTVDYFADDNELAGLGVRIHFDSSVLGVADLVDVFDSDLIYANSVAESDTDNLDGIESTDSFITAGWASVGGDWTSTGLPEDLLTVVFDVAGDASGSTKIGFSAISTPIGWGLYGVEHDLHIADLSINSNGEVKLASNPDYESQSSYDFTVVATDEAGMTAEQDVSVSIGNVDEAAPTITSGVNAESIEENSGAGQVIYTAQADDSADVSSGSVTFSLEDADPALAINSITGQVFLLADPDHELQSEYTFTVVAKDAASHVSDSQTVTLAVDDLDDTSPFITSVDTVSSINENTGAGQVIYTAVVDDSADVNDGNITFELSVDSDPALSIDSATGEVTLASDPNHEDQGEYSFTVIASDGINPSVEQSLTLNVNDLDDAAPIEVSGQSTGSIDENTGAGQVVYAATANDSGDDVSGGVTFSLTSGSDSALSIDESTGVVVLAADPDHEGQSQYSFTVIATDAAGNATEGQEITININDLDDAAPTVTSGNVVAAVEAGGSAGEVIYTATGDDSDDISGGISYSLISDSNDLSIDANSGAVTLNQGASADGYSFSVVATDAAGNSSSAQTVSMGVYQTVSGQQPVDGGGDIQQTFTHNADGSITLSLTVDPSLSDQFDDVTNLDLDLSYNPSDIDGGSISSADISSPATFIMANDSVPGTLSVGQIYFNGLDLQAGNSIMDVTFNLSADNASFDVNNVLMNDDVAMGSSSASVSVASASGDSSTGDDIFMLEGGYSNVQSGGSDTFVVSSQVDESVVIDFDSESDTIEMAMLLDAAGYSEDDAATNLGFVDLDALLTDGNADLNNAFGASFDEESSVLELFVDTDKTNGVSIESYEVTLSDSSDFDDDDLSADFSAFIA